MYTADDFLVTCYLDSDYFLFINSVSAVVVPSIDLVYMYE